MVVIMICQFLASLMVTLLVFSNAVLKAMCNTRSGALQRWKCILCTDMPLSKRDVLEKQWGCWNELMYLTVYIYKIPE